jgi:hypothetical protein
MKWLYVSATLLAFTAPSARAGLIGTDVTLNYTFFGTTLRTDTFLVTSGVEITCANASGNANVCFVLSANLQTIDVGPSSIAYSYTGPGAFFSRAPNAFDFEDLNLGGPITSVALSTDTTGLDLTRIFYTPSSVQIDMTGLSVAGPESSFTLDLSTAPEPAGFFTTCFALAGFIVWSRFRGHFRL